LADRSFRNELKQRKLVATLYELGETNHDLEAPHSSRAMFRSLGWSDRLGSEIVTQVERFGLIERRPSPTAGDIHLRLTEVGRRHAARVVRGERLWSAYLDEFPEQTAAHVDLSEAEVERFVPREVLERLASKLHAAGRLPPDSEPENSPEDRS
jgi:Mn-dependent DtxR family transcriptional regulator